MYFSGCMNDCLLMHEFVMHMNSVIHIVSEGVINENHDSHLYTCINYIIKQFYKLIKLHRII